MANTLAVAGSDGVAHGFDVAEGSKPPSVLSAFGSASVPSAVAQCRATCRHGLAPVRIRRSIRSPSSANG